ncbi:MAG: phosphotransacetylase family protein, partial [Chloroflexota bacterium]
TALCSSLGKRLQADGKTVGYLKPLLVAATGTEAELDSDTEFVKKALGLKESISPISLTAQVLEAGQADDLLDKVKASYTEAAKDKDVVLIEGLSSMSEGASKTSAGIAEAVDAKVVAVLRWNNKTAGNQLISFSKLVKDRLVGAIINAVPATMTDHVKSSLVPLLDANGIRTLGVIPEERSLLGTSVAELVRSLDGEVLNSAERTNELVESVMVGALSIDSGLDYFKRKANKAVITRGDRPDLQNAALETSTKCLILTNGKDPIAQIRYRSEEKGVPMIKVQKDTLSTIAALEEVFPKVRFQDERKLERFSEMVQKNLDLKAVYSALGI